MTMKNNVLKMLLVLAGLLLVTGAAQAAQAGRDGADPRILIAYFSQSGNTRLIANDIQKLVGGDLFEIKTVRQYAPDFDTNVDQAREDLRNNARPKLAARVSNMAEYDVVFVGFPNWVGTMPMPVFSFLEQHDFKGKTIVPFCTHGTSGISNTVSDLRKLGLGAEVRQHIGIYRNDVPTAQKAVADWLGGLGYINQPTRP